MRPTSSSSLLVNGGSKPLSPLEESSVMSSQSLKKNPTNPPWTVQAVSNEIISNKNRIFGFEFLRQAALYIPQSKTIDCEAVAQNIEIAIYRWSIDCANVKSEKRDEEIEELWLDGYWKKIHDLAACISGKRQGGTLAGMIGEGKFATPEELVGLSDDDLWCSFQGLPLS
mmetsp:Transcript_30639/g.65745  ORF Transcript_30639/g.65745 Transcript_30639/m.65745 type:complete len:170 (+) Transcript_30639:441-950(+)